MTNGNLTGDGLNTYTYDIENRLIGRSGGAEAALFYDPLGRLFEVSGASGTTRFVIHAKNFAVLIPISETEASPKLLKTRVPTLRYSSLSLLVVA